MIIKVISGGQTGADMAGLNAARRAGIPTGGWAPYGYLTELGPMPALLKGFNLKEHTSSKYPPRTFANINDSHLTLLIAASYLDRGSGLTRDMCISLNRPMFHVMASEMENRSTLEKTLTWISGQRHEIVNVAGNRESRSPGIGDRAEEFLFDLFTSLKGE
jgi:putative molybdenum carrier protein